MSERVRNARRRRIGRPPAHRFFQIEPGAKRPACAFQHDDPGARIARQIAEILIERIDHLIVERIPGPAHFERRSAYVQSVYVAPEAITGQTRPGANFRFWTCDKPKKDAAHSFGWHRQVLLEFIDRLDLRDVVLVVQDWGGILGLTLPMAAPGRYQGLLVMNTTLATGLTPLSDGFLAWRDWCKSQPQFDVGKLLLRGNHSLSAQEAAAYNAPFPDKGYRAALRAFPPMVPESPDSPGAAISRQAQAFWQNDWQGRSLMAVGVQDPVLGEPVMRQLQSQIRGCPEPLLLPDAGHFVQEQGRAIAEAAVRHFQP